jgi:3',5'-cyclic AMP phosphodiesterase CpdA
MRILHISDLHLKAEVGLRDENLLSRLHDFLKANVDDAPFDHIAITGDLRDVNDCASVDDAAKIIEDLVLTTKIAGKHCVHIIPGNHDLTRGIVDAAQIQALRTNYNFDNGMFRNANETLFPTLKRFEDFFFRFCAKFYNTENPYNPTASPHALRVVDDAAFIYLNSCLTCIDNAADGNLLIGLMHLRQLLDNTGAAQKIFILSHHPIQNLATREEAGLADLIKSYEGKKFYWLCGDVHHNRTSHRGYIWIFQVGSLTGASSTIPDFAIYDIDDFGIKRRVFRFLPHLNSTSAKPGGWKRVYIDPQFAGLLG